MFDDPLHLVVGSTRAMNTHVARIETKYSRSSVPNVCELVDNVYGAILTSGTSRCNVYQGPLMCTRILTP